MGKLDKWLEPNLSFKTKVIIGALAAVVVVIGLGYFFGFHNFNNDSQTLLVDQNQSVKNAETLKKANNQALVNKDSSAVKADVKQEMKVAKENTPKANKNRFKPIDLPTSKELAARMSKTFKRPKLIRERPVRQVAQTKPQPRVYNDNDIDKPDRDIGY